ncbi:protein CLP1 homolog isoform X2 [Mangifera indica]|uniref:protein CLP1 homolog isoform X2 n=1 Tax=Mangifera indica TaxID=29780 RepID=UPI001CFA7937|nr:protein CLP1 homolog isoform X2 [Mangifera indica]
MVERSLSMREVPGSIPRISNFLILNTLSKTRFPFPRENRFISGLNLKTLVKFIHTRVDMAYGGAPAAMTGIGSASASTVRQVKLDKESELRIEVGNETHLNLRVLNGNAEIFGTELPPEIWLTFPPRLKFAVFTWYGATIEMDGATETDYTADETPMVSYVNVHAVLDGRRNHAKASASKGLEASQFASSFDNTIFWEVQGPRVIVVGPTDSGKSTLTRMLLSWAAKQGWKPTYVDLDIGQGSITVPGSIAATPIELPIDPIEGIPLEMALVYFFGHPSPSNNVDLYKVLVKELAQMLEKQFTGNAESRAAGMVINTMGWIEGVGYELILHAIDTFNANVVLVLGQEKLFSLLRDVLKNKPNVDVVKLQKSGGVVSRNAKVRQKTRSYRIREYFYGLTNDFSPHANVANISDLHVYRIGGGPQAPRSALPIGADPVANPLRLVPVNVDQDLLHLVLAVSYAKEPDEIISSNVAGFIYITDIDMRRKTVTYLSPSAGILPSKYLIVGTLAWLET